MKSINSSVQTEYFLRAIEIEGEKVEKGKSIKYCRA